MGFTMQRACRHCGATFTIGAPTHYYCDACPPAVRRGSPPKAQVTTDPHRRWCGGCNRWLAFARFYVDRRRKDGRTTYCKRCLRERRKTSAKAREYAREYRAENAETVRAKDRARAADPARREMQQASDAARRDRSRTRRAAYARAYYAENREDLLAAQRVRDAARRAARRAPTPPAKTRITAIPVTATPVAPAPTDTPRDTRHPWRRYAQPDPRAARPSGAAVAEVAMASLPPEEVVRSRPKRAEATLEAARLRALARKGLAPKPSRDLDEAAD